MLDNYLNIFFRLSWNARRLAAAARPQPFHEEIQDSLPRAASPLKWGVRIFFFFRKDSWPTALSLDVFCREALKSAELERKPALISSPASPHSHRFASFSLCTELVTATSSHRAEKILRIRTYIRTQTSHKHAYYRKVDGGLNIMCFITNYLKSFKNTVLAAENYTCSISFA